MSWPCTKQVLPAAVKAACKMCSVNVAMFPGSQPSDNHCQLTWNCRAGELELGKFELAISCCSVLPLFALPHHRQHRVFRGSNSPPGNNPTFGYQVSKLGQKHLTLFLLVGGVSRAGGPDVTARTVLVAEKTATTQWWWQRVVLSSDLWTCHSGLADNPHCCQLLLAVAITCGDRFVANWV